MMVTVISKPSIIENPKTMLTNEIREKKFIRSKKKSQVQNSVSKSGHNYNKLDNKYLSTIIEAFYKQFDCMLLLTGN